jgi:uroporphyrinogen-III synthase
MILPLKGKRIVVTRDLKQSVSLIKKIKKLGGTAIPFPVVCIKETDDWSVCDQVIAGLNNYDWLMFTSINGARYFLDRLAKRNKKIGQQKIAVVGKKIAAFLKKRGVKVEIIPEKFQVSGLIKALQVFPFKAKRVILPVSSLADDGLMNFLKGQGCEVKKIQVYRTVANTDLNRSNLYSALKKGMIHCLTFFSPSAFRFFVEIMGNDIITILNDHKTALAVIGDTTARIINDNGLEVTIKPAQSSEEDLVKAIVQYFSTNN